MTNKIMNPNLELAIIELKEYNLIFSILYCLFIDK